MLLRNNAFFPVKIFGIILLTKRFFWKNNFGFGRSIFKILCRIYDGRPDLHRIGHLDRRIKNIYFKARNGRWPILRGALFRFKERFFYHGNSQQLYFTICITTLCRLFNNSNIPQEKQSNDKTYVTENTRKCAFPLIRKLSNLHIFGFFYVMLKSYETLIWLIFLRLFLQLMSNLVNPDCDWRLLFEHFFDILLKTLRAFRDPW